MHAKKEKEHKKKGSWKSKKTDVQLKTAILEILSSVTWGINNSTSLLNTVNNNVTFGDH